MTPETLATLHAQAFAQSRAWSAAEFRDLLSSPHCFVTGDDRSFAVGRVIADEAELLTIATDPHNRRKGLGRKCLASFETIAREQHATTAFLEVAADNTAAKSLYLDQGYEIVATRKAYYKRPNSSPVDALVLRKTLA